MKQSIGNATTGSSYKQEYDGTSSSYYQGLDDHSRRDVWPWSIGLHKLSVSGKGLSSFMTLSKDGRIRANLEVENDLTGALKEPSNDIADSTVNQIINPTIPPLNIVIMIVGSRGDVQPYVALGLGLVKHGHRVRIATHETFRSFVLDAGLDFYPIGGDPKELLSYMVKNPGILPGFESLTNGDIGRKRKMLVEMFQGCWRATVDPGTGHYDHFVADAIISNPPVFAHIHIAEALGIPLLLSFTMPWSPTKTFPHPLVNIDHSNAKLGLTNYLTYGLADVMTWEGLSDITNKFRTKTLGIPALSHIDGPGLVDRLKVPWTYCLSPALIPKPSDWKNHIDVVGFYFLEEQNYQPDAKLESFLNAGPPPVYIGFGSVVVEDPAAMTKTIFGAIKNSGVRALVSVGWGGLGGVDVPSDVFMLGNVPHDWLFQRVAAVVHHGGAGTTAIGLKMGKPTAIVPFFGDQPFWGAMVYKAGAGPEPIPQRELNVTNLTEAIGFCMSPGAKTAAEGMGRLIQSEDGVKDGIESFHRHLPLLKMRCDLDPNHVAVWCWNEESLRLSAFSAQTLIDAGKLRLSDLLLHRSKEYTLTNTASSDPVAVQRAEASIRRLLKLEKGKAKGKEIEKTKKLAAVARITEARRQDGVEAVRVSTPMQRAAILQAFEEVLRTKTDRRAVLGERASCHKTPTLPEATVMASPFSESQSRSPSVTPPRTSSSSFATISSSAYPPPPSHPSHSHTYGSLENLHDHNHEPMTPYAAEFSISSSLDEDEAFARDMKLALQLSLAEQRDYERGRSEAQ